jgi:hypothetical protein
MEGMGCLDVLWTYECTIYDTDVDLYILGDTPEQNNTVYLIIKTYKTKVPTRRISFPQAVAISISNVNHIGVSVGEDSTDKI